VGRRFDADRAHIFFCKVRKMTHQINTIFTGVFMFLITVAVLPHWTLNPTTMPKAWLLNLCALVILINYSIKNISTIGKKRSRKSNNQKSHSIQIFFAISIISLSISFLMNSNSDILSFFGSEERRTGFVFYVGLYVIFLVNAVEKVRVSTLQRTFLFLALSNVSVCIYSLMQDLKIDFFESENFYENSASFLGNSNFVSGFIGFSCWAYFSFLKRSSSLQLHLRKNLLPFSCLILNVYTLYQNKSSSGMLAIFTSSLFALFFLGYFKIIQKRPQWRVSEFLPHIFSTFIVVSLFASTLTVMSERFQGLFIEAGGKTRLAYWKTALRLISDDPFFGKGPEAFTSNFLKFREVSDLDLINKSQIVDSPHNLLLEILTIGGISLCLVLLAFLWSGIYNLVKSFKLTNESTKSSSDMRRFNLILLLAIVGFLTQSLLNVSNIAICAWGFLLISLANANVDLDSPSTLAEKNTESKWEGVIGKRSRYKYLMKSLISSIWISVICLSLSILSFGLIGNSKLLFNESQFIDAALAKDGLEMLQISKKWPPNERLILGLAKSLDSAGYKNESLEVLKFGVEVFPDNIELWVLLMKSDIASLELRQRAKLNINEIDPLYFKKA
jgi:O-Antigen ligase